jgi:peptide chain release factor 1
MLDRLDAIKAKFDDIGVALTNPAVVSDNKRFSQLSKEYRSLEKIVVLANQYRKLLSDLEFNREALMGDDDELRDLAKMETAELEKLKDGLKNRSETCLFPKILKMIKMPFLRSGQVLVRR